MQHIESEKEFESAIESGNKIVDFYAAWCGPCRMLSPILEEIEEETENLSVLKVNVDEVTEVASRFAIQSIPTLHFYKDGKLVYEQVGYLPKKQLLLLVDKYFAE